MSEEVLFRRGSILVRRQRLSPGEALPWHRDPFHRVSVVLSGDLLAIEYRDGAEIDRVPVAPGTSGLGRTERPCSSRYKYRAGSV
jgi:hypothetical protein